VTDRRWAPADPAARDETITPEAQLARVAFYYPPKEAARILATCIWASDEQKTTAFQTQQRMTAGAEAWR